jgi:hypothetical protein
VFLGVFVSVCVCEYYKVYVYELPFIVVVSGVDGVIWCVI